MAMHIGSQGKKNDDNNAAQEEPDSPPPVLVFLNGASGGKKGLVVRRKIEPLIPSAHLFDLDEVGKGLWKPEDKLKQFQHLEGVKVLICGGDGTMGWILSCIDRLSPLPEHPNFAVGMMPLGTGNDLARSYGWGPGFSHRMLKAKFLEKVKKASAVLLDRWQLCVMPYKPLGDDKKIHDTHMPPTFTVHTYSSNFGGATFGPITDASEHGRTQSVLRMGRSFSTRMSSQAFAMQEEEADRSSRRGSFNTAGSRRGSFNLTGSRHGQGGEWKDEESAYERGGDTAKSMTRSSSAPPVMRYGGGGGSSGGSGSIGSFPSGSKGGLGSTMNALPTVGETVAENAGGGGGGAPTGAAEQEEAALVAAAAAAVEAAVSAASVASAASTEGDLVVESALASEEHEETKWAPAFARSSSGDSAVMPAPADAPVDAPADASVHALVDAPVVAPAGTRAADAAAEDAAAEDAPSGAPAAGAPAAGAPAADVPSDAAAADATAASAIAADATAADATAADATAPGAIATDATAADVLAADTPAVDATDTPTADAADTPAADAADAADTPATDAADTPAAGARTEAPSDPQEKLAPLAPEGALQSRQEDDQVETGSDTAVTAAAVVVGIGDSDGGGGGGVGAATAEGAPKPPPQPPSSPPLQSPPGEKVEGGAGAEGNVFVAVGGGSMVDAGVAAAAASAAAASAAAARLAGETLEKREEVAPPERVRRTGPMPRATPSISVTQRYDSWESYDAVFCNYFSFGVDAVAALAFHEHRNKHPHLFTSRCRNQLWYARKGFPAAGGIPCSKVKPPASVGEYLELRVRRTRQGEWETIALKESLRGVVVLNLQSYGGGRNLWGKAAGCSKTQYAEPAPDDKILEIVGMGGIIELGCIMGFNNAGVRAQRLCQAAEVEIRVRSPTHMQIDGEPWLQAPAKICIKHYGQSTCLRGR